MPDAPKTNAARLLESRGVAHRVRVYDAAGAFHSADEAAELLGVPGASVLKTLVVLRQEPKEEVLLVLADQVGSGPCVKADHADVLPAHVEM